MASKNTTEYLYRGYDMKFSDYIIEISNQSVYVPNTYDLKSGR